jgi:hypothetical protein
MEDAEVRRCTWLLLKVYGVREAQRVAASFRDALAAIGDYENLQTWKRVALAADVLALVPEDGSIAGLQTESSALISGQPIAGRRSPSRTVRRVRQ